MLRMFYCSFSQQFEILLVIAICNHADYKNSIRAREAVKQYNQEETEGFTTVRVSRFLIH